MPSSLAPGKKAIRTLLATSDGLRESDGVSVRSADLTPDEMTPIAKGGLVLLGNATVSETREGLNTYAETVTVPCWAVAVVAGSGEDAVDAARDKADELFGYARATLTAHPDANGAIPGPARVVVAAGGMTETPVDWSGAARRADRAFTLSWTSHITI